jgi:2-dehydro-3-deoxyphosphogluconate aldolase/(4S)-4-hydroxy-2-oxoglutarate aldolase
MPPDPRSILAAAPVIPVLTIERAKDAVPLARALVAGGLPVLEVTLRTSAALAAIAAIAREVPEAIIGAGTITRPADIAQAVEAGAKFLVSPGTPESLALALAQTPVPALPGCATVSEAMALMAYGFPTAGPALLSDRRHRWHERRRVSGDAERRRGRRLVGRSEGRDCGR